MERENIHATLGNLRSITGIEGLWEDKGPLDGVLEILVNARKYEFLVELKNEVRPYQVHQIERYHQKHENFLVIANRIFPKVKEELRLKGIAYLEANGNVFLKKENLYVFVDTQKYINLEKEKGNRAFTKTGLKVLFHLLNFKEHLNLTQRDLAEKAGVALGNIPQVLNGLKETGYIIPLNNKEYVWGNRKELMDRWIAAYGTTLKPKLKKDKYTYKGDLHDIQFNFELTVWGGEPAADILTNYLRPEKFELYTRENRVNLMRNYKLIPDINGEVEAYEMFWNEDFIDQTAPPILIYADLILGGGKRNKETAEKIFNEYIQPIL